MMKTVRATVLFCFATAMLFGPRAHAQYAPQQVLREGLLTSNHRGSFKASAFGPDGSLYLLLDEGDGIRVLKTDSDASTLEAEIHLGAAGDSPVALTVDPSGNVYIAGTSTSGALAGTAGTPFPAPADNSSNSFVAKLDPQLDLVFLTFVGSGQTAASSVAVNSSAVFVTGSIFSATLPVTASAVQQAPASGSTTNGFVESFSADGSALIYATYLTGPNGDTEPAAIAADSAGDAIVAGETSASGYPTVNALQSAIAGSTSGFLTELTPAGDGIVYSTFIAGSGLTGLALNSGSNSLFATGAVALGQFPVAITNTPLTSGSYQSLLQISADGQSVVNGVVLGPGAQSSVTAAPDHSAWVTMRLSTPLLPATIAASSQPGDSLLLHVLADGGFAQSLRAGGAAIGNASYASLTTALAPPAVSSDGSRVAIAGTATIELSSSLLSSQRFDFATTVSPDALLPYSVQDIVPDAASCGSASQCIGTGALLTILDPTSSASSLAVSTGDLAALTLSNPGSAVLSSLSVRSSDYTLATNCGSSLAPGAQCGIALSGAGPGDVLLSASGLPSATLPLSASQSAADPLALSTSELDFGIVTGDASIARNLMVSNLSGSPQTFTPTQDAGPSITPYTLAQSSTTCSQTGADQFTIAANGSCNLTFTLTAASSSANDGPVRSIWKIGSHDVALTGFSQANGVNLSASEIDFGQQSPLTSAPHLPRYLFVSNNSQSAIVHTPAALPAGSPFTVTDGCASTLQPQSVCRIAISYQSTAAPSFDSATLTLDGDLSVLLTGQTASLESVSGSATDPNVSVSPASITFPDSVTVTELSSSAQAVQITNSGPAAVDVTPAISGDFTLQNLCPAALAASSSCELLISFAPSQPGVREGLLSISAGSGFSPITVTLTGTATPILAVNDGAVGLGSTNVGEPVVQWYPIQAALPALTVSSSNPAFTVAIVANSTSTQQPSLPSSAFESSATGSCVNCWLGIEFLSQTAGSQSASLSLSTVSGGNPQIVALSASATAPSGLLLTPASADFGAVPVHSSTAPITFTLTNLISPATSASIQSIIATGDFAVLPASTGDCTQTIASTAACTVQLVFAPSAQGTRSGTLTVVTDSGTSTAALAGTGTADAGLALQPTSLVFNNQAGAAATQQTITVVNTGSSPLTIGTPSIANTSFAATTTCGALAPSAQCYVVVTFTPGDTLPQGTLMLPVSTGSGAQISSYAIPLSGSYSINSAGLVITPSESNLGSAATDSVGAVRQFTVTNVTARPLAIGIAPPRQFPLTSTTCSTLASNTSCTFSLALAPAINGPLTGTVQVTGQPGTGTALQSLAYAFGYGAGAGVLAISGGTSPLNFGDVSSGQTTQQTVTLTNSGTGPLTIHRITSQAPFFAVSTCGAALAPSATCTVAVSYSPVYELAAGSPASGIRQDTGAVTIESDAVSSPDTLQLTGTATAITSGQPASAPAVASYTLSSGALTFALTQVGDTSPAQTITLTNTGTTTLHVSSILAPQDFTASSTCATILPSAACLLTVQFTPGDLNAQTVRTGTLEIRSDASDALEFVTLLGSSTPAPLTLSPTFLDFGSVNAGQSGQLTVTAANTGSSPIRFGAWTATGPYDLGYGTCPASGGMLAAGAQCTLNVTFMPSAAGAQPGTISLSSSATQQPLTLDLTGTGVANSTAPSFNLSVNGAATASLTISSGQPAAFILTATPVNGFSGPVALTCTPLGSAPYASCSLLASSLTIGADPQTSTATINTVTSTPQASVRLGSICLIGLFLLAGGQFTRTRRKLASLASILVIGVGVASLNGCGSGALPAQAPPSNLLYTPAGTYQWKVTASSTSGISVSSSVVLTVTVQ